MPPVSRLFEAIKSRCRFRAFPFPPRNRSGRATGWAAVLRANVVVGRVYADCAFRCRGIDALLNEFAEHFDKFRVRTRCRGSREWQLQFLG